LPSLESTFKQCNELILSLHDNTNNRIIVLYYG
jgi:hypothetical protein